MEFSSNVGSKMVYDIHLFMTLIYLIFGEIKTSLYICYSTCNIDVNPVQSKAIRSPYCKIKLLIESFQVTLPQYCDSCYLACKVTVLAIFK